MTILQAIICLVAFLLLLVLHLYGAKRDLAHANSLAREEGMRLRSENARLAALAAPPPRKSEEERRDERLEKQLEALYRKDVEFYMRRVMGQGELRMFYSVMDITGQPQPANRYPFYVFPQVSLGEIIGTRAKRASLEWQAGQAHRAINSKRCDVLIASRQGWPVAVLEYQGEAHDLDGTAERRDKIKRTAVEAAGIRYVEIEAGTSRAEIGQIVQVILDQHIASRQVRPPHT